MAFAFVLAFALHALAGAQTTNRTFDSCWSLSQFSKFSATLLDFTQEDLPKCQPSVLRLLGRTLDTCVDLTVEDTCCLRMHRLSKEQDERDILGFLNVIQHAGPVQEDYTGCNVTTGASARCSVPECVLMIRTESVRDLANAKHCSKQVTVAFEDDKPVSASCGGELLSAEDAAKEAFVDALQNSGQTEVTGEPSETNEPVCFPAEATVELEDGSRVRMDRLSVGDRVRVGAHEYSAVFGFTHKMPHAVTRMVRITTEAGASFVATLGHYVYANGKLTPAGRVRVGDIMTLASGELTRVADTRLERGVGLYNPQTQHGDVCVDGVVVSTYTTSVPPSAAHSSLAPLRLAFKWLGLSATWSGDAFHTQLV